MIEIVFPIIAFLTSLLTAVLGLGGGLLLIALMPGFIPTAAIIPIHAFVQLSSNVSRAVFDWRTIRWEFIAAFLFGSIIGVTIAANFLQQINLDYITIGIAVLILLNVWAPGFLKMLGRIRGELFTIGIFQSGLALIGGAVGPLANASLLRKDLSKNELVTTSAVLMAITHVLKIIAFIVLGVSVAQWWKLILGL